MDKKIFVERETYEKNGKQYFTYFIKGVVRGIEARVQLMPPDFTGYTVWILFSAMKTKLNSL